MNFEKKRKIIQESIQFLKTAPNGKKGRRKPFLKAKYLDNKKVFFEIFIPKILQCTLNDQYRRMKDLPHNLPLILQRRPKKEADRYIFDNESHRAIVIEKQKIRNNRQVSELYLLSFFDT